MTHQLMEGDHMEDLHFVPYEDVMGIGHSGGEIRTVPHSTLMRAVVGAWLRRR